MKNKKLENDNLCLTRYYMDIKYDSDMLDTNLNTELSRTKIKNTALHKSLDELIIKNKVEADISKKEYDKRTNQMARTLRGQLRTKSETSILAQRQCDAIKKIYVDKINQVRTKYQKAEEKYNKLKLSIEDKDRINLANIELTIRNLREQMKKYEEYANGLKKLTQSDYDHYKMLQEAMDQNNEKFFEDTKNTEEELLQLKFRIIQL